MAGVCLALAVAWQDAGVELLPCGHAAFAGSSRMCVHLISTEGLEYVRLLNGNGLDGDLCCEACDQVAQRGEPIDLLVACDGCVIRCTEDWGTLIGWRGTPGILDRPESIDTAVIEVALPVPVADIAPVAAEHGSVWLLLTEDGQIGRFDAEHGTWNVWARCTVPDESLQKPWMINQVRRRLHASANGRYAVVVNDFGQHGQVIDLATGDVTMKLAGGSYHSDTVPFSVALVEHGGRTMVIHRTGWNRLDVSDAATAKLVTPRQLVAPEEGARLPEHYRGYFHGRLFVSPR